MSGADPSIFGSDKRSLDFCRAAVVAEPSSPYKDKAAAVGPTGPRGSINDSGVELSSSRIEHDRLVIIGAGPAAYTAAIYAARALLKPLVLAGFEAGGQLMTTTDVENYPGFAEPIQGPWLMEQMRAQAENVGARIEGEHVVGLELGQRPFVIRCDSGRTLAAAAIILATGAKAKWLGLPSEDAFKGFGVSACATCDGFFFRGKSVAVVGGGNTAVEEALGLCLGLLWIETEQVLSPASDRPRSSTSITSRSAGFLSQYKNPMPPIPSPLIVQLQEII